MYGVSDFGANSIMPSLTSLLDKLSNSFFELFISLRIDNLISSIVFPANLEFK